jgi:hypothetical protein
MSYFLVPGDIDVVQRWPEREGGGGGGMGEGEDGLGDRLFRGNLSKRYLCEHEYTIRG